MLTTKEMKDILFKKLQDENTCFKKSDISIKKSKNHNGNDMYVVTIDNTFVYEMKLYYDNEIFVGTYTITVFDEDFEDFAVWVESKKDYDFKSALIQLGYHIANTI